VFAPHTNEGRRNLGGKTKIIKNKKPKKIFSHTLSHTKKS
jgi:hypothetical protein